MVVDRYEIPGNYIDGHESASMQQALHSGECRFGSAWYGVGSDNVFSGCTRFEISYLPCLKFDFYEHFIPDF
jgi:hypothetical protein